ncbi:MAG: toprim domain-containing protein [Lachnospiraceae bacterium]|nr:toprim domain-containing protein [Lachnospiraceae bacterium]
MGYIKKEDVARAKEMDLLTYLQNYEPWELKHIKGNFYQTVSHDSLKISNGMWYWWSKGIGGKSALDYLIKVRDIPFQEAVQMIIGNVELKEPIRVEPVKEVKKSLVIPEASDTNNRAMSYLSKRGIDEGILKELYDVGLWYETKDYHNVAFVGVDDAYSIKLVTVRGTVGAFKNTVAGSDRHFPVRLVPEMSGEYSIRNNVVHLFEAPIDMLSYMTLMKQMGTDYRQHNFIALCGIYKPKENLEESTVPIGLSQYLKERTYTKTICLHLDNDRAGRESAKALNVILSKKGYTVIDQPPPEGFKDCNDFLMRGSNMLHIGNRNMERGDK